MYWFLKKIDWVAIFMYAFLDKIIPSLEDFGNENKQSILPFYSAWHQYISLKFIIEQSQINH